MKDSADDPSRKDIADEAARWIAACEGDALSSEEETKLRAWLAADPRHERAFAEMQDIWAHMGAVPETAALRATIAAPPRLRFRYIKSQSSAQNRQRWIGPALAASLALIFVGVATDLPTRLQADEMTATGERRVLTLSDGSTVHLDTHSAVALDFTGGRRVVRLLAGEAAFTVAPDPRRPFTVETAGGSATALGTRFLVSNETDGGRVTVTEHRVRVAYPVSQEHTAVVTQGQSIAYGPGGLGKAMPIDTANAMAWTEGVLVFKDRPLGEVVEAIGRYHRGYIRVVGDAAALRVSGVFRIDDPVAAINQLQRSLGLRSTRITDRLIFLSS